MADFAAMAREAQAASIRVIATSAAREAVNRDDLTAAIEQASGLTVEVITGEQEAEWGFQGVTTDPQLAHAPCCSWTSAAAAPSSSSGADGQALYRHSFPLGSVRLMETIPCSDPPQPAELAACRQWLKDFLNTRSATRCLMPAIEGVTATVANRSESPQRAWLLRQAAEAQLVGVGGTATILGCMEAGLDDFRPRAASRQRA